MPHKRETSNFYQALQRSAVNISAAAFMLAAMMTTSHAAPPSGPREISPEEQAFFHGLMVPPRKPESLAEYLLKAEAEEQGLNIIGNARNNAGAHCCGVGDCRYVESHANPDGSYTVYLGQEFPSSKSRTIIVGRDKFAKEEDVSGYTPKSSVLCARPDSYDLADKSFVFCFRAAGTLTENNPGNWLPYIRERQIAEWAKQYVRLVP
jgi:hypothetical protein